MHPGRPAQCVYVLHTLECVWRCITYEGGASNDTSGEPNGVFSYNEPDDKPYFSFHWRADEQHQRPVRFRPIAEAPRWYRAEGDDKTTYTDAQIGNLKNWHIVVYKLL